MSNSKPTKPKLWVPITGVIIVLVIIAAGYGVLWWYQNQATPVTVESNINRTAVIEHVPVEQVYTNQFNQLDQTPPQFITEQTVGVAEQYPKPLPVEQLTATSTSFGGSLFVHWVLPLEQTYNGIELYRSTTAQAHDTLLAQLPGTATEYLDATATDGTTYYYSVRSYRSINGAKTYSNFTDSTASTAHDITPPAPPSQVVVKRNPDNPNNLVITWQNDATETITTNNIYRSTVAGELGNLLTSVSTAPFEDTTGQPAVQYYYTVTAVDAAGNESSKQLPTVPAGNQEPFVSDDAAAAKLLYP